VHVSQDARDEEIVEGPVAEGKSVLCPHGSSRDPGMRW
jgi:hypothetical protein